jgi:hypothetical protein
VSIPKNHTIGHIRSKAHKIKCYENQGNRIVYQINQKNQALGSNIVTYAIKNVNEEILDVRSYFNTINNIVTSLLASALDEFNLIKFSFERFSDYHRQSEDNDYTETKSFMTATEHLCKEDNMDEKIKKLYGLIKEKVDGFQEEGSGWSLLKISRLEISISEWRPLGGGCKIKIPDFISKKKAVVNIECNDNYCFAYAVQAYKKRNDESINDNNRKFLGNEFPMKFSDINRFERQNDLRIVVYGLEEKKFKSNEYEVYPLYTSKNVGETVHLLYIDNPEKEKWAFCMGSQPFKISFKSNFFT